MAPNSCPKHPQSKRELINEWKTTTNVNCLFDLLKSTTDPNSFAEPELFSYNAQLSGREGYVTDEPDSLCETDELSQQMDIDDHIIEFEIEHPVNTSDDTEFLCPEVALTF